MRSLVAAFLIPQLVALPVTQVLGQATQQEPQVTQTDEPRVLLSAPVVDSNTVLLLASGSVEVLAVTDSLSVVERTPTAISNGGTVLTVVAMLVIIGFLVLAVLSNTTF
jgi:hypothetical protein